MIRREAARQETLNVYLDPGNTWTARSFAPRPGIPARVHPAQAARCQLVTQVLMWHQRQLAQAHASAGEAAVAAEERVASLVEEPIVRGEGASGQTWSQSRARKEGASSRIAAPYTQSQSRCVTLV
eukprot:1144670-Prorocentrum_minimum.AAC.1